MWRWTGVLVAIAVLAGIGVLMSSGGKRKPAAVKPTTAPGSIRKGEPVSKHFESVLERLSYDTFRISVRPIPPIDPEVYLTPGPTKAVLLVLDTKGEEVSGLPEDAIVRVTMSDGPPDKDGRIRRTSRTFKVNCAKLPKGTYIISGRVEAGEEGKNAAMSQSNYLGSIATRVRNSYELVVRQARAVQGLDDGIRRSLGAGGF